MSKKIGKEQRFLNVLRKGKTVSRKQARSQYKLGNPSATVLRFEQGGWQVFRTYSSAKSNGRVIRTVKYSMRNTFA